MVGVPRTPDMCDDVQQTGANMWRAVEVEVAGKWLQQH